MVLITFALGVAVGAAAATVPAWVIVLVVASTDAAIAAGAGVGIAVYVLLLAPWAAAPFLSYLRQGLTAARSQSPIPMEQQRSRRPERDRSAQPRRQIPYWLQIVSLTSGIVTGIGGMVVAIIALWD
jgi:hypothetical protein